MRISGVGKRKPSVRTALAAIGLAVGGLVAGAGGASAAALPGASSWPAQVARPAAAGCPAGETLIAPTGGWTDSLGVSHIAYSSRPGMVDEIAPNGLTASRVTPGLLTDLGLGVSGASKAEYQMHVNQALSMARTRTAPEFCYSPTPIAPPARATASTAVSAASVNAVTYSPNWGGTAISEYQSGSGINGAEGDYAQPRAQFGGSDGYSVAESTWVGDGDYGDIGSPVWGLIQAGTTMLTGYGYRAFYEAIGSSGCTAGTSFCGGYTAANAVTPGQDIFAFVFWENSTNACFYVAAGATALFDLCSPVNIPYDHTSAEWINENHEGQGFQYTDPSTVTFTIQSYSNDFDAYGGRSPFATPDFDLVIMGWGGNYASGTPISCSNPTIMSYPTDGSTSGGYASSEIITCPNSTEYEYPA
jgi:hypothetical protein